MAGLFSKVGTKISATARFSTVGGESGSADTARDPRGFSVKLRTEEGNWDHVYVSTLAYPEHPRLLPVKLPHFVHTQQRGPVSTTLTRFYTEQHARLLPPRPRQVPPLYPHAEEGPPDEPQGRQRLLGLPLAEPRGLPPSNGVVWRPWCT
jgi:hypothetical protein